MPPATPAVGASLTASLCRSSVRTFALDSQGSTASGTWVSSRTSPRAATAEVAAEIRVRRDRRVRGDEPGQRLGDEPVRVPGVRPRLRVSSADVLELPVSGRPGRGARYGLSASLIRRRPRRRPAGPGGDPAEELGQGFVGRPVHQPVVLVVVGQIPGEPALQQVLDHPVRLLDRPAEQRPGDGRPHVRPGDARAQRERGGPQQREGDLRGQPLVLDERQIAPEQTDALACNRSSQSGLPARASGSDAWCSCSPASRASRKDGQTRLATVSAACRVLSPPDVSAPTSAWT